MIRPMPIRKSTIETYFNKAKLSIIQDIYFDVFKREFPICDRAQGLNGDPLILYKGNPHV